MKRTLENKIILVTRKTRLEELIAKYNTVSQAKFYVEHLGADFSDYTAEHEQYQASVRQLEASLQQAGRVQNVDRSFLPNFMFGAQDIVVSLGQDGLVVNTLKYLDGQALVGVNPDPKRWDGVLLPFSVGDMVRIMPEVLAGRRKIQNVTMAKVELNDGQLLYGVNDIFIGPKTHISARYRIAINELAEQQSSSGVIVSTGLGSTGWLKSLMTGASAIAGQESSHLHTTSEWDADRLTYIVREPFTSQTSSASLIFGTISQGTHFTLTSLMPENGVIFSDGIEADYLEFNSGIVASVGIAEKTGHLVV